MIGVQDLPVDSPGCGIDRSVVDIWYTVISAGCCDDGGNFWVKRVVDTGEKMMFDLIIYPTEQETPDSPTPIC